MDIIKTVLERKWKLIKHTFFYDKHTELPLLFSDFQQYLKNTPELNKVVKRLSKIKVIPDNFLKRDFNLIVENEEPVGSPYRDDFNLIGRIYNAVLNEIDMQALHLENDTEINKKEIKIRKPSVKDMDTFFDIAKLPVNMYSTKKVCLKENILMIIPYLHIFAFHENFIVMVMNLRQVSYFFIHLNGLALILSLSCSQLVKTMI